MYICKIEKIITNNNTEIIPKKINIIVGPNNSGKSRFLKDIKNYFERGNYQRNKDLIVIKNIAYTVPTNANDFIERYKLKERINTDVNGNSYIRNYYGANFVHYDQNISISNLYENNHMNISSNWENEINDMITRINNVVPLDNRIPVSAQNIMRKNSSTIIYEVNGQKYEIEEGSTAGPIDRNSIINNFKDRYGCLFFQYLGTEEKLFLCKKQVSYGQDSSNINLLSETKFHIDDMKKLSELTHKLFGKYLYLDRVSFTNSIAIRVSDDFDFYKNIVLDDTKSEKQLRNYPILDEEGDGIKNFVTSYISMKTMNKDIILMDEPESFLHPPLAKCLGEIIAKELDDNQQLFISTHSEDLIKGILCSCRYTKINIIHIQRHKNDNIINVLTEKDIYSLRRKPVVLMSNILKGLFSDNVYITESFSDSALYSSIMEKKNPYSYYYFVNTESKDKIKDVINIYDKLGVNNVAIFDFDYFRDINTVKETLGRRIDASSKEYKNIVDIFIGTNDYLKKMALNMAKEQITEFESMTKKQKSEEIKKYLDDYYHKEGIKSIKDIKLRNKLNIVLKKIKKYGIYVLITGSLETILEQQGLNYSANKPVWIDKAIEFIENMDYNDFKDMKIIDLIDGKVKYHPNNQ